MLFTEAARVCSEAHFEGGRTWTLVSVSMPRLLIVFLEPQHPEASGIGRNTVQVSCAPLLGDSFEVAALEKCL